MRITRCLITPLVLAAVGCSAMAEGPTTFILPEPILEVQPVAPTPVAEITPVENEPRQLIPAKQKKSSKPSRTVKPKTVNAVTVFDYVEDKVYPVAVSPGFFTAITLQPGEKMPGKVAIGDPDQTKWRVDSTVYGSSKGPVVTILLKPGDAGLKTNLFIATDRRSYQLIVTSFAKPAMDQVRWEYQDEPEVARPVVAAQPAPQQVALDPVSFNFDYRISVAHGDSPRWLPVRTFDTGIKRYIEFPGNLGQQVSAPALFSIDQAGNAVPIQFRPIGKWYEIDRQFSVAELRLDGSVVRIVKGAS